MMDFKLSPCSGVYVETGCNVGRTLAQALQHGFDAVHGIEIVPELLARVEAQDPRLQLHLGHSPEVLPQIVDPTQATTFYLDSHYTAGMPDTHRSAQLANTECPLQQEVSFITQQTWEEHCVVVIDDWFMFFDEFWESDPRASGYTHREWPHAKVLIDQLTDAGFKYENKFDVGLFNHKP